MIPCGYRASTWVAALPSCMTLYVISVRQTRDLPPPSFRFYLAVNTLGLSYILPTTGRIRDLHPLETCAARRTTQGCRKLFLRAICPIIIIQFLTETALTQVIRNLQFCRFSTFKSLHRTKRARKIVSYKTLNWFA